MIVNKNINDSSYQEIFLLPKPHPILLKINLSIFRLASEFKSIIRPLSKFSLSHLLFKVSGIMLLVSLIINIPVRIGLDFKDVLINTFYTQAMNVLCSFADEKCENSSLPVPVRFFLDDFGTNCKIEGFDNMISNIRSRNISALIVLQSESQLIKGYGFSAHTIIDNCDTLIYMGGNDVDTATTIAKRANKPLSRILDMPVGTNWIFRRGEKPRFSRTIDIYEYTMAAVIPFEYTEDKMYDEITFMDELVS